MLGAGLWDGYHLLRPASACVGPHPLLCLQHNLKAETYCESLAFSPQPSLGQGRDEATP